MSTVQVEMQDDLAGLLKEDHRPIQDTARELIILELYRQGRISSGKASEFLNLPRRDFIALASRLGVSFFDLSSDEWEAEKNVAGAL